MDYTLQNAIIGSVFLFISYILLLIGSIFIYNKLKNKASLLVLLGIIFTIFFSFSSFFVPFIFRNDIEKIVVIQGILNIIANLSLFIFALGILLVSLKHTKQNPL